MSTSTDERKKIERIEKLLAFGDPSEFATADAAGNFPWDRYEELGIIGQGAMGIVYKVRELATGRIMALKKMKHFDATALDRFKREYRTLQDIRHKNLVTIFDPYSDGKTWCFTMELINGQPFPGTFRPDSCETPASETVDQPSDEVNKDNLCQHHPGSPPERPESLRGVIIELAEGILALHEHNVLHRDIKPSNVLCTPQGNVKILDVGLVTDATHNENSQTHQGLAGTYQYMPLEQANGQAEKASDWYSFGVVVYQALTGKHPFRGTAHEMPWARQGYEVPPPRSISPTIPEDLSQLCVELLCLEPSRRPLGPEILCRLRMVGEQSAPPLRNQEKPSLIGRETQLEALWVAFKDVQDSSVVVFLHGQSGMGKSSLAQHFLDRLRLAATNVVVLKGRCYERESVPYKALDGLVDSLCKFWRRLPRDQAKLLLPVDVSPLVDVFPVLKRVEAVAEEYRPVREPRDPHQRRRDAFSALREVLRRIGMRRPLVIHLDDLQWGDVDSAMMLTELLLPPNPPPLLLLASFRSEDRETSPFLRHFLKDVNVQIDRRELPLERLTFEESRALAAYLLGGASTAEAAELVARESAGNPFFIFPLVQAFRTGAPVALDQVLWTHVCSLSEVQRRLLEIVAVAGRPMYARTAIRAAELDDEGHKAIIELQAARLLKGGSAEEVETYHDRIRETIAARLPTEIKRERHRRLAIAIVSSKRDVDPEVLAEHWHRCGELERAGEKYEAAAVNAGQTLAFDRAAKLYRLALEVRTCTLEEKRRLQTLLGQALADAGRGADAAQTFRAAAAGLPADKALDLQRRAGEQFLRSGHLDEGIEAMRLVLAQIGIKLPETRWQIFRALAWGRFRLWWRGTNFRERHENEIQRAELDRIDLCFNVGNTLALADAMRGKALHVRYFYPMALNSGEPGRVALAYSMAAVGVVIRNGSNAAKAEKLLEMAREQAHKCGRPYVRAMITAMDGCVGLLIGDWKRGYERSKEADDIFAKECTGVAWERGIGFHYMYTCLMMRGLWKQSAEELPTLVRDALERGDLFTATSLQIHSAGLDLANDDALKSKQTIADALRRWPARGFHLQHHHAMIGDTNACLYSSEFAEAMQIVNERWPDLRESMLLHIQEVRVAMVDCRARCTIAASMVSKGQRERLLQAAERDARSMAAERMPYTDAIATLLFASIAYRRGRVSEAIALLDKAVQEYHEGDMLHVGASVRWRLGELLGDKGKDYIKKAREFLLSQGIRNPVRFLNIHTAAFSAPP